MFILIHELGELAGNPAPCAGEDVICWQAGIEDEMKTVVLIKKIKRKKKRFVT
jgi:hypothetical protein